MKQQHGMSGISFLILVILGLIIFRGVLVVVPLYFDDINVGTILDNLDESERITRTTSTRDVRAEVARRLDSNNIKIDTDGVIISRERNAIVLDWTYENRAHFIGNIDVVLTFHQHKEFSK